MREDGAFMLGALVVGIGREDEAAFTEFWNNSCLEGDNVWKAASMLDILRMDVVLVGIPIPVGTCKEEDVLLTIEEVLDEEDEAFATLLVRG